MPLRSPNNPNRDAVIIAAMKNVINGYPTPNTALALNSTDGTGQSVTYAEREYDMLNTGVFPAVLLSAGVQGYTRQSRITFNGQLVVDVDYYASYTNLTAEMDDLRAFIAADLELMKSNLEANETLVGSGNVALTIAIVHETLSRYKGMLLDYNTLKLVHRVLSVTFNLLDYDASS